ncbi:MAG: 3-phosphoglycerate dehydrogenase [Ruminococcaceae bacterium]|nr:3-phosphoglycerate dehydrogenase [Oscillospiraceae bacterium]
MNNILLLNKIAKCGTDNLDAAKYNIGEDVQNPDGIMVRSANMLDMEFNKNLLCIARAGAGVNNIPIDKCSAEGIVVFNTPGANANGVKELAVCALLLAARDIVGGIDWVKTLKDDPNAAKTVEKNKSKFGGTELKGKTLGVIGLGAIGGLVANIAVHLGMNVIGCDPYLSIDAAWNLNHRITHATSYDEIYKNADYVTLHVPATPDTKGMINASTIALMKDGAKVINLSRDSLVNSDDMKAALASGKIKRYVTDFATPEMIGVEGAVLIPHLGASTEESEDNCAVMAALELDDYITNGNIKNSVNYPALSMPRSGDKRVCVLHDNTPGKLTQLTGVMSECGCNIENMTNKSRGSVAYTILDVTGEVDADAITEKLTGVEGVARVRVI